MTIAPGSDLLGAGADVEEPFSALDEAVQFLIAELSAGPQPASKTKKCAGEVGISAATLRRAKESLQIGVSKTGYQGAWEWSLSGLSKGAHRGLSTFENQSDEHLCENPADTADSGNGDSKGAHSHENEHLWSQSGNSGGPKAYNNGGEEMVS